MDCDDLKPDHPLAEAIKKHLFVQEILDTYIKEFEQAITDFEQTNTKVHNENLQHWLDLIAINLTASGENPVTLAELVQDLAITIQKQIDLINNILKAAVAKLVSSPKAEDTKKSNMRH